MALSTCEQLVLWFYGLVAGLQSQPNDAAGAAGSSKKSDLAKGQLVGTFMKIRAGKLACFLRPAYFPLHGRNVIGRLVEVDSASPHPVLWWGGGRALRHSTSQQGAGRVLRWGFARALKQSFGRVSQRGLFERCGGF